MLVHELKNWTVTSKEVDTLEPFYKLVTGADLVRAEVASPAPCFKVKVGGEIMLMFFAKGDVYITRDDMSASGFVCSAYPDQL